MVNDPNFLTKLEEYINMIKPEAAYFVPLGGQRSQAFIVNVGSNDQVPAMVEPLFQWMGVSAGLKTLALTILIIE